MPYHVIVTRQLLLDGPAVLCITLAFWMFARFVRTERFEWLAASAAILGLAVLTKETSVVLAGSMILFLLVSAEVRRPGRAVALTVGVLVAVSLVFPLAIQLAGRSSTGQNYLTWQLTRSSNHAETFYLTAIPAAIGWAVVGPRPAALFFRVNRTWRELLLVLMGRGSLRDLRGLPPQGLPVPVADRPGPRHLWPRAAWRTWHLPARWDRSPAPSPDQP